jgi:hypothetical protein
MASDVCGTAPISLAGTALVGWWRFIPDRKCKPSSRARPAEIHCRPDEYVQRLVEEYVDYDAWFRGKVGRSLERLDRGELVTPEQVSATIKRRH